MKKIAFALFGFIILSSYQAFSQFQPQVMSDFNVLATRNFSATIKYEEVAGTPYYTPVYVNSTVILKDGNYANVPVRFDMFQDEVEFLKDGKMMWLPKDLVNYVKYGGKDILVLINNFEKPEKMSYYFLPVTGDNKLFVKKAVQYVAGVEPKGYQEAIPEKFEQDDNEYFIQLGETPVQKIKNKKSFEAIFAGNSKALAFIKSEKIKSDKEADLIKLVRFLNGKTE